MNIPGQLTHLSLFTGAGGSEWTAKLLGWRTVGYVESDAYCRDVIRQRVRDGIFDDAPIFPDVRTFDGLPYRGRVDIVSAGFPCQPFSAAGKRLGESDERNLWPDTFRILREVLPTSAFLENVPRVISSGYIGTVLNNLDEIGYSARWLCLSAAECGAPHIRKRMWIVAHANSKQLRDKSRWGKREKGEIKALIKHYGEKKHLADTDSGEQFGQRLHLRSRGQNKAAPIAGGMRSNVAHAAELSEREPANEAHAEPTEWNARQKFSGRGWWMVEPEVGRVVDGLAPGGDDLRALGNGWVPCVAARAWCELMQR